MNTFVRKRIRLVAAAGAGLALACIWLLASPRRGLLERAHRVTTIWRPAEGPPYHWLNDEEVLIEDKDRKQLICDRRTGETRPLTGLVHIEPWGQDSAVGPFPLWSAGRITGSAEWPEGNRTACAVVGVPPAPYPDFIFRWLPNIKRPERTEALFVRTGSSSYHEVGRLTPDDAFAMSDGPAVTLTHLRWLPGGRSISFLHGDTLYVVDP